MEEKFGAEFFTNLKTSKPRVYQRILRSWIEDVKFRFGNTEDENFEINVPTFPNNSEKAVEDGFHKITRYVALLCIVA